MADTGTPYMANKDRYRELCREKQLPLFMQAWWMDAVCSDEAWGVLFYEEKKQIQGVWVFHLHEKFSFKVIVQPKLTQYGGVWLNYPSNVKLYKRYSFERKALEALIKQIEALKPDYLSQNFHHTFSNWQPLYWQGFKQNTRYTYVLENIGDTEKIFENIYPRNRQRLRKAKEELEISFDLSPKEFYAFHKKTLQDRSKEIEYSEEIFLAIYEAAYSREQGAIISVKNKAGELLSALFFVWDALVGYNLITAKSHYCSSNSNDTSIYMIWEAINFLKGKTQHYDFEGSMIEGVALFNQYFGAKQQPYFNISKRYSSSYSFLKWAQHILFRTSGKI